jgi:hypothetical protein
MSRLQAGPGETAHGGPVAGRAGAPADVPGAIPCGDIAGLPVSPAPKDAGQAADAIRQMRSPAAIARRSIAALLACGAPDLPRR